MFKKVLSGLLCLILCFCFSVSASDIYNIAISDGESDAVIVKGCLGEEKAGADIKISVTRKNGTVYSYDLTADSRGCYYHRLNFDKNISDCSVNVICDGEMFPVTLVNDGFSQGTATATKKLGGKVIWVEGKTDPKNAGKTVNILMLPKNAYAEDSLENGNLAHIGYAIVNSDGYYSYKFSFDGDSNNYKLLTKLGNGVIINNEISVIDDAKTEMSLKLRKKSGEAFSLSETSESEVKAFVKNKFSEGKRVSLLTAFYNADNTLLGLNAKPNFEIPFELEGVSFIKELTDSVPVGTEFIKLMIWEKGTLTPMGEASEYNSFEELSEKEFYVSPQGSDFNDGSLEKPFKTLRGAKNAVRLYKEANGLPKDGIKVYFRGGEYPVTSRVDFTEKDSGTKDSPITYSAYQNEEVIFSGGVTISGSDFVKASDSYILGRLPDEAKNNVYAVDLKSYGIYDYGDNNRFGGGSNTKVPNAEVFYNNEPMVTARYPDIENGMQKYLNVSEVVVAGTADEPSQFKYTDETIERASDFSDVIIEGWFTTGYEYEGVEIGSVDKENDIITFSEHNQKGVKKNNRYVISNFPEALDKENEYYLDRKTGMLYLYPTGDISSAKIGISVYGDDYDDSFIKTDNASYLNFEGLCFELSRSNGIVISGGDSVKVDNCQIRNIGLTGVIIGNDTRNSVTQTVNGINCNTLNFYNKDYKKSYNHQVVNSEIYNTGEGAVKASGGDRLNLVSANHKISNCVFHDCNRFSKADPILSIYGVGIEVSGCDVYNSACSGIVMGGNEIIIKNNEFWNCANDCNDMGVIYSCTFGAEIQAGSEICYNYFHDTPNVVTPEQSGSNDGKIAMRVGVYNDYCDPFLEVHHNVFENMPMGIVNGGGYENNWKDNVFKNVYLPMFTQINNNLLDYMGDDTTKMFNAYSTKEYKMLDVDNGVWKQKYPQVAEAKAKMISRGTEAYYPSSTISNNVCIFTDTEVIKNGYNYVADPLNFKDNLISLKYFNLIKYPNQAKYMTISNNDYTKTDKFDASITSKNIDLTKIGKQ